MHIFSSSIPSIFVITSPICNPLLYAGESSDICATYIPSLNFKLLFKYGITFLSYANIPNAGSSNFPSFSKRSITFLTLFIGTANPIPSADVIFTVLIPITSPFELISGPPLFPWIYCCICLN